jgi:hypothetical protein
MSVTRQWRSHSICDACWGRREPERVAVRVVDREYVKCCFCGATHQSGIFVREHVEKAPFCTCSD